MSTINTTTIIVTYQSASLTIDSIKSVFEEKQRVTDINLKVVVVDNHSGDYHEVDSFVHDNGWQDWVKVINSKVNGGFGYGNNLGVSYALNHWDIDYFHLLNPDTRLRENAISALVKFLEDNPVVGVAGSSFETEDGSLWPYAFRFPGVISEFEAGAKLGLLTRVLKSKVVSMEMDQRFPKPVDWVSGASMMIRRTVVEAAKGFDESFFLYYEETDLCKRIADFGYTSSYVPESRVMHILGQSTGVTEIVEKPKRKPKYWFESRSNYFIKNHGIFKAAIIDLATMLGCFLYYIKIAAKRLVGKPEDSPTPYFIRDMLAHSPLLLKNKQAKLFKSILIKQG